MNYNDEISKCKEILLKMKNGYKPTEEEIIKLATNNLAITITIIRLRDSGMFPGLDHVKYDDRTEEWARKTIQEIEKEEWEKFPDEVKQARINLRNSKGRDEE